MPRFTPAHACKSALLVGITLALTFISIVALISPPTAFAEGLSTFPLGSTAPDIEMIDANGKQLSLKSYFDNSRILLIFVPDDCLQNAEGYCAQFEHLSNAFQDRALQVVVVVKENSPLLKKDLGKNVVVASHNDYVATIASPNAEASPLSLLIGKDKTIKLRERQFIPVKAIFAAIDSMPMRKEELKRNRTTGR